MGALEQYSKCCNIICHIKPHSIHVCLIIITPYLFLCIWNLKWFYQQAVPLKKNYPRFTSYSLWIDKHFLDNQFVSSTNDTDIAWYSKYVGGDSGLKFIFKIKYKKGHIFNLSLTPLDLDTEIFYYDIYATTFMPLYPLKDQKSSQSSKDSTAWWAVTVLLVWVFIILWVVFHFYLYAF